MNPNQLEALGYDSMDPLNVGLHMYTSGLERLYKLALACHSFASTGRFASVRKHGQQLSKLPDAIDGLDMSGFNSFSPEYLARVDDAHGDELPEWLERFASGGGRYEILDSLPREDADVLTWDMWVEFCSRGVVSEDVEQSISLRTAIGNTLTDISVANDLESVAYPILEAATRPLYTASAAVGLAMYRRARRPAEVLASVTNYTSAELPILREAVNKLTQTTDNFFAYDIAGLSDREPVVQQLTSRAETFVTQSSDDEDGEWTDEPKYVSDIVARRTYRCANYLRF